MIAPESLWVGMTGIKFIAPESVLQMTGISSLAPKAHKRADRN